MKHRTTLFALVLFTLPVEAIDSAWVEIRGGDWSPSAALVSDLETKLSQAIRPASQNRGRIPAWESYTFQYQGKLTLLGNRYVRVNAFCDSRANHAHLTTQWVLMLDGGACFFSAKYDVEKKHLYDIIVNGVA